LKKNITLLELGILEGGSLQLWRDYFPRGVIVGIDLNIPRNFSNLDRIRIFQGRQEDTQFLRSVAMETAPEGFDIIIDDASHIAALSRVSFWYLFENHLKPGGLYAIEDWGTGYWDNWPDGKSVQSKPFIQSLASLVTVRLSKYNRIKKILWYFKKNLPFSIPLLRLSIIIIVMEWWDSSRNWLMNKEQQTLSGEN
jgi:hypothetical protein